MLRMSSLSLVEWKAGACEVPSNEIVKKFWETTLSWTMEVDGKNSMDSFREHVRASLYHQRDNGPL